jgi:hypothetical protein
MTHTIHGYTACTLVRDCGPVVIVRYAAPGQRSATVTVPREWVTPVPGSPGMLPQP